MSRNRARKIYSISFESLDYRRLPWIALTGVCAGTGIWATHFVAMLAYGGDFPTAFEPAATLGSLILAILFATLGFGLANYAQSAAILAGGAVIGASIGIMHYIGMRALLVPGTLQWDMPLVAFSWIAGPVLAASALFAFHRAKGPRALIYGATLLTLAICALHFTSMGALTIVPDPTVAFQASALNRSLLAIATAGVTFIVLFTAMSAAFIQRSNMRFELTLREQNARFEAALHYLPVGLSMFDAEHRLIMCNRAYREVYGLSEDATRPGIPLKKIMHIHTARDGVSGDEELEKQNDWLRRHQERLLPHDENSAAIVRAVCELGRALNLSITAEGVETQEQFDYVKKEGCTEMQGYFFSKPIIAADLETFIGRRPKTRVA